MISFKAPDLTIHPPRSPRVRLGGFVILPRLIDKGRAHLAGKTGLYKWANPLDHRLWLFTGIKPEDFLAALPGKSDTQVLAWVTAHLLPQRQQWEIEAWSHWMENLSPGDAQRHKIFSDMINELCPGREDVRTLFDRLDIDDYATFGGEA